MTVRYPYKGQGLEGFERARHSHSPEELAGWYRAMLRIRRVEEEIERRYHEDQMKTPIHLVIGQEATAVGCCSISEWRAKRVPRLGARWWRASWLATSACRCWR